MQFSVWGQMLLSEFLFWGPHTRPQWPTLSPGAAPGCVCSGSYLVLGAGAGVKYNGISWRGKTYLLSHLVYTRAGCSWTSPLRVYL